VSRKNSKSKKTPLFIEFLGLPGSGKTTLSHHAAEILREKGTTVLEPTYLINNETKTIQRYLIKSWYSTKLVWLRPVWVLNWFRFIVQSRQKTLQDFMSMIVNCFYILEIYRHHSRHNDICFLDQGICQALLSLSYNSKKENLMERKLVTAMDFLATLEFRVIHIETGVDTIVQRLKERYKKQSRLELIKNTTDFVEIIRDEKRKIDHLLKVLRTQLQVQINTIQKNRSEDIRSAARYIAVLFIDQGTLIRRERIRKGERRD
jgi:energy-coupling factor transporter ATP-binding protein EcfA2